MACCPLSALQSTSFACQGSVSTQCLYTFHGHSLDKCHVRPNSRTRFPVLLFVGSYLSSRGSDPHLIPGSMFSVPTGLGSQDCCSQAPACFHAAMTILSHQHHVAAWYQDQGPGPTVSLVLTCSHVAISGSQSPTCPLPPVGQLPRTTCGFLDAFSSDL